MISNYPLLLLLFWASSISALAIEAAISGPTQDTLVQVTRYDIVSLEDKHRFNKIAFETNPIDFFNFQQATTKAPTSTPFIITTSCQVSNQTFCTKATAAMNSASNRIAQLLRINTPITVSATIRSFCARNASSTVSCSLADTLGQAASNSFFTAKVADGSGYYLYPQSLVKQLNVNKNLRFSDYDIIAEFNSDFDFWYPSDGPIQSGQTDFEFVFAHEITHGLGFDTRWINWASLIQDASFTVPTDFLAPFFTATSDGKEDMSTWPVKSWEPLQAYDAYCYQSTNNKAMTSYVNQIYGWSSSNIDVLGFITGFFKSGNPFSAAKSVYSIISSGPNALKFSPVSRSIGTNASANGVTSTQDSYLATSTSYVPGSSIAHLDYSTNYKTADFLMIPAVQDLRGRTLDDIINNNTDPTSYKGVYGPRTLGILGTLGWPTVLNDNVITMDVADDYIVPSGVNANTSSSATQMTNTFNWMIMTSGLFIVTTFF